MPEAYQDAVFNDYRKKRENGELSIILSNPTTTKLRKECLRIYDTRYRFEDDDILSTFFDVNKTGNNFRDIILKSDPDDYKALLNHINEKTEKTDDKNSELLAWLVDFEHRPSTTYYKRFPPSNKKPSDKIKPFSPPVGLKLRSVLQNSKFRYSILISALILFTSGGAYIILQPPPCMYWSDDHYERISCDQDTITSAIVYNEKVARLRRITKRDTLTKNSIGKVFYAKFDADSVDFFTDSGEYPMDRRKRLLPVTAYMLRKYVFDKIH